MCRQGFPMCFFFLWFLNTSPGSSAVLFPSLGTNPIQYTHPHHSPVPGRFLFWVLLFHTQVRPDIICQKGPCSFSVCCAEPTPANYKLLYRCEKNRIDRGATSQRRGGGRDTKRENKIQGEEKKLKPCAGHATNRIAKQVKTKQRRRGGTSDPLRPPWRPCLVL